MTLSVALLGSQKFGDFLPCCYVFGFGNTKNALSGDVYTARLGNSAHYCHASGPSAEPMNKLDITFRRQGNTKCTMQSPGFQMWIFHPDLITKN